MKLVTELNELGESDLPGHESHRAAGSSEVNRQVRIRHEPVKLIQLLVNEVDCDFLSTFALISTQLLSQQLSELLVAVVRGVNVDDDVSFVAVSVREFHAILGRGLIVWTPDDVLAVAFVRMLFDRLVERRRQLIFYDA